MMRSRRIKQQADYNLSKVCWIGILMIDFEFLQTGGKSDRSGLCRLDQSISVCVTQVECHFHFA